MARRKATRPSETFDLTEFLPYRLVVATQRIGDEFVLQVLEPCGISIHQWRVLAQLSSADAISVRDITARVSLDKSQVSRAVTCLVDDGYVTKLVNDEDRRLVCLSLTDSGRYLMDDVVPRALAFTARLRGVLNETAEGFELALARILDSFPDDQCAEVATTATG